jgi:hypothetical protein
LSYFSHLFRSAPDRCGRYSLRSLLAYASVAFCAASLVLSACGLPSETKDDSKPGDAPIVQTFRGTFSEASTGEPKVGLLVAIVNTSTESTTNEEGLSELQSTETYSGDVELVVVADWGSTAFRLEGVIASASLVSYEVAVDSQSRVVEIVRISFDGAPPTPTPVATKVGGPVRSPTPRSTATPKPRPTKTPSGGGPRPSNCLDCHGDRGAPRCGDAVWKAIHRAVYRCPSKSVLEDALEIMRKLRPR